MRTCSFYNGKNGIPAYHCNQEWLNTKGIRTCYWLVFIDITIIHSETFYDLMVWWWRNGVMVIMERSCTLFMMQMWSWFNLIVNAWTTSRQINSDLEKKNLYSWCDCLHRLTRTEKHLLHLTLVQKFGWGWCMWLIVCLIHLYQQHAERNKLSHWILLLMFK